MIFPRIECLDILGEYLGVQTYELLIPDSISHEEIVGDRIKLKNLLTVLITQK